VLAECAATRLRGARAADEAAVAIVDGDWHLIFAPASGRTELYHRTDVRQEHDLAAQQPEELARLRTAADAALARALRAGQAVETSVTEIDAATRAALEALGYAGDADDEGARVPGSE
jgi:hypothetical protein